MKKRHLLIILIFLIIFMLFSGCSNFNYSKFFPEPPTTNQLLQEEQSGELADPLPINQPSIDGVGISFN